MLVKSQCIGNRVTGLYVGENNVRRYFPRKVEAIDLKLDHLVIQCGLRSCFWDGEPEIHDARLCLWLESKQSRESNSKSSVPLYMSPAGKGTFVLGFAEPHPKSKGPVAETAAREPRFKLKSMQAGAAA
jgi:hypothetical protein